MSDQTALPQEVVALETSSGVSRRNFFALSAAACGAAALLSRTETAQAAMHYNDAKMLRFLEEVERVELSFFNRAALSGTADGMQEREMYGLNGIAKQDNEHVYWFKLAREKFNVGALARNDEPNTPASQEIPTFKFPRSAFETRTGLYALAVSLKETSVGAYQGALQRIDDPTILQAVASLAGVESRHLALIRQLAGQPPFVAYEKALRPEDVRSRLLKYGFHSEVLP